MIHLALRSEFSFKKAFGPIKSLIDYGPEAIGVADLNNTFAHYYLEKHCKDTKPIYGVRVHVVKNPNTRIEGQQGLYGKEYILIAKNSNGLEQIYNIVKIAYDNFYYRPMVGILDIWKLSKDVIVIAKDYELIERVDYIALSFNTPKNMEFSRPVVAIIDNYYPDVEDKPVYEAFSAPKTDLMTWPQHIVSDEEYLSFFNHSDKAKCAIENTYVIAEQCDVKLNRAPMVRYTGMASIDNLCKIGAKDKGICLDTEPYKSRYNRELDLIEKKDYIDYFLIVSDMINYAKKHMLVGPSRGSSAGSLVCYLLNITEIDPIKFDLLFERFIDINRADLPDIDIDFPDEKRDMVIKYLSKKYGADKVKHIATVSTMKPKVSIGEFAKSLGIPPYETDAVKDAIIERSGGDARAAMCIQDTLESTEVGKAFLEKYPEMKMVEKIEGHARHSGVHAAGIIVANENLTKYAGVNTRDDSIMIDKYAAEYLNLLKIDCLGLRTLSILEECANLKGFDFKNFYTIPLDDKKTFEIFNDMRLSGIFQFEGYALQSVTREMGVQEFNDLVAITALARPGPLHSGGTNTFVSRRTGQSEVEYISNDPLYIKHTEDTLGIIIYQEQLMTIGREYGGLSWEDVSELRKAASKSLGEEFFNKYKENFLTGTRARNIDDSEAIEVWENMVTFGSWGFNKSHAVSYSLISYWTAWCKAHHPLEFVVANLNHAKDNKSAIKILRDAVEKDGIEYISFDRYLSDIKWSVQNGKVVGGLTNLKGIGVKKAKEIIDKREFGLEMTPSIEKILSNPETDFDILFPCKHYFGDYWDNPQSKGLGEPPHLIKDIQDKGYYIFIGRLVDRNLRDLNEYQSVVKRGGKIIENNTLFLNMTLEDDTDSIICTINRYIFEEKGREIAERGVIDKDWYLVAGEIKDKWRRISVADIIKL